VISRGLPAEPDPGPHLLGRLSNRQREVAELVATGLTNASIGRRLSLTEDTVKKYVSRALAATGCRTRTELALLARSNTWPARTPGPARTPERQRPPSCTAGASAVPSSVTAWDE